MKNLTFLQWDILDRGLFDHIVLAELVKEAHYGPRGIAVDVARDACIKAARGLVEIGALVPGTLRDGEFLAAAGEFDALVRIVLREYDGNPDGSWLYELWFSTTPKGDDAARLNREAGHGLLQMAADDLVDVAAAVDHLRPWATSGDAVDRAVVVVEGLVRRGHAAIESPDEGGWVTGVEGSQVLQRVRDTARTGASLPPLRFRATVSGRQHLARASGGLDGAP